MPVVVGVAADGLVVGDVEPEPAVGAGGVAGELASQFKFASQKSKLAGTIRGSYFAFKNEY